ncbi:hypothetical protein WMY93_026206 [Mugilogobius chulae]|uniref:LNR domain-containing protein n=1 Tax=Mugilogobius chulae TaxID=88201 RepID=A0AAW0N2I9_9GOBI
MSFFSVRPTVAPEVPPEVSHPAVSSDPWGQCPVSRKCKDKFGDGSCDRECKEAECLRDGFDCVPGASVHSQRQSVHSSETECPQLRDRVSTAQRQCVHSSETECPQLRDRVFQATSSTVVITMETLTVTTAVTAPPVGGTGVTACPSRAQCGLRGLCWCTHGFLSLRASSLTRLCCGPSAWCSRPSEAPRGRSLWPKRDLFQYGPGQLEELLTQTADADANGSLLALQVDNRPCSSAPSSCFPYTTEAASFLSAVLLLQPGIRATLPELQAVISLRGLREEVGSRDQESVSVEVKAPMASWMWAVVAVALGLVLFLCVAVLWVMRGRDGGRARGVHPRAPTATAHPQQQRHPRQPHPLHRSRPAKTKPWGGSGSVPDPRVHSTGRDRDKLGLRKKKKNKEEKRRRREPLGEDAMRMRPLRREQDIGSDTDVTQSSMEDISRCSKRHESAFVCDHRAQQRECTEGRDRGALRDRVRDYTHMTRRETPPRVWDRSGMPPPLLSPPQHSAEWCGPDGSVVLIRAVRSGLDRVVLELLRAGVPVNNTDHTGRSALHWACSVNHLSLARTLIRYGAAVDLQDNKGETALFLSALHGCYDTARLLLLHGANPELRDRRGRHAVDAAQEAMHHQILEMLLSHQIQRRPAPVDQSCDELCHKVIGRLAECSTPPLTPGGHRSTNQQRPGPSSSHGPLARPITTLQEVTSEDEDRERPQDVPRAITPHFLSPQPAPRQRSFSCTQHALQRRPSAPQPEPNYVIVTPPAANELAERALSPPRETSVQSNGPALHTENLNRAEPAAVSPAHTEQKSREGPRVMETPHRLHCELPTHEHAYRARFSDSVRSAHTNSHVHTFNTTDLLSTVRQSGRWSGAHRAEQRPGAAHCVPIGCEPFTRTTEWTVTCAVYGGRELHPPTCWTQEHFAAFGALSETPGKFVGDFITPPHKTHLDVSIFAGIYQKKRELTRQRPLETEP